MITENRLWVLYLSIGIDILGVGMVIPLLSYYTTALGGDPWYFGLLVTLYGIMQLIGSPIMGRISDTYGRKTVLLISFVGSGLGYFTLGFANSLPMLFLSRIPVGLVKQTMSASKAYITDISEPSMRAKNFGIAATAAGIGFIIGPTFGGIISAYSPRLPPFIAGFLFVIDFIFVYFMLPDSTPHIPETVKQSSSFNFALLSQVFKSDKVGTLLFVHVLIQFSLQLFRSNFPLYIQTMFYVDPKLNGFILSYCSLLEVLTQSLGIGFLSKKYTDNQLILSAVVSAGFAFMGTFFNLKMIKIQAIAFIYQIPFLLVALAPVTFATATLSTCIASALTKLVDQKEIGLNLGVFDSFEGLSRVLSPSVGGIIMEAMGAPGVPLTSAALFGLLSAFVFFNFDLKRKNE